MFLVTKPYNETKTFCSIGILQSSQCPIILVKCLLDRNILDVSCVVAGYISLMQYSPSLYIFLLYILREA